MDVLSPAFQTTTLVVLGLILLFDLLYVVKRPHEPSIRRPDSGSASTSPWR